MVEELTKKEFYEFIQDGTVLIDFFAEWCMPCVMMSPIVDEIAEKFGGKLKVGKINVEDNQEIAGIYSVSSIPNFVLFRDGEVIDQFIGSMSSEDLEDKIKSYL